MVALSPLLLDENQARRCFTLRPLISNDFIAVTYDRRVSIFEADFCCDICDSHNLIYVTALFSLAFLIGCDNCDICDICDKRGLSQTPFLSNENNAVTCLRFSPPKGGHGRAHLGRWASLQGKPPMARRCFTFVSGMGAGGSKWEKRPGLVAPGALQFAGANGR